MLCSADEYPPMRTRFDRVYVTAPCLRARPPANLRWVYGAFIGEEHVVCLHRALVSTGKPDGMKGREVERQMRLLAGEVNVEVL